MKSWKTTLAACLAAAGSGMKNSTDPLAAQIGTFLEPVGIALIGFFARDNNVSSESVGAK